VRVGYWLLALGCWLSADVAQGAAQNKPRESSARATKEQVCGPISDGVLKCPRFGFSYKIPFGWVDRTNDMQPEIESTTKAGAENSTSSSKSQTLLAIFERPPAAPGETINSAVVIAAESVSDYHAVKQASDYLGPISELAEQRGFKSVSEPYSFPVGAKRLVRADFSKERGKLTMWQSSLVIIERGYIVSFTFVSGGEDDVEELIRNLNFATKAQPHK
jgi:hypothetical protein